MELTFDVSLEQEEKKQERFKINWLNEEEFLRRKDLFLAENLTAETEILRGIFPEREIEDLELAARLSLLTRFTLEMMADISPIKLEKVPGYKPVYDGDGVHIAQMVGQIDVVNKKVNFYNLQIDFEAVFRFISNAKDLNKVVEDTDRILNDYQGIDMEMPFGEARKVAMRLRELRIRDLDVVFLATGVQEFAHMLYTQESLKSGGRKWRGILESERYQKEKYSSREEEVAAYYAQNIEYSGRLWQLLFLKKYFPDSHFRHDTEKQIKKGIEERRKKEV